MSLIADPIDIYCSQHSTGPSALCAELETYTRANVEKPMMVSGPVVASVLGMLLTLVKARRVLEIGCYTGYSALSMAERLPADGEVITIDINPKTNAVARSFWDRSPHGRKITALLKPATDAIAEISGTFDFVFIDADKENYLAYLEAVLPRLSENAVVVADNCLWSGRVVGTGPADPETAALRRFNAAVRENPALESVLLPVRDGLHVIRKRNAG